MAIKYYKLFDLLARRGISKTQMRIDLGFSTKTLAKINAHTSLNTSTLERICRYYNVQPCDIMEFVDDE